MAFTEDVKAEFFRDEDFANDWIVNGVTVRGHFDDTYVEDLGIEGTSPQLLIADADVAAASAVAGVAASGPEGTFTIRGLHRSGDGTTILIFEDT